MELVNDTHTTDGEHYRTPAHPRMISALGRAVWAFLTIEECAVAVLYEAETHGLDEARQLSMRDKERALKSARKKLETDGAPASLLGLMDCGIDAFRRARVEFRNPLSHAGLFTAGYDENGVYLPGVALSRKGQRHHISDAKAMHTIAHGVESCASALGEARSALRAHLGL